VSQHMDAGIFSGIGCATKVNFFTSGVDIVNSCIVPAF
jgi:hypothetical protein